MKALRNLVALATLLAMVSTSASTLNAQEYASNMAGDGYYQSSSSPSLTPAIALGAIAIIAIIAVAVQNSSHHHHHGHSH